MSAIVDPVYAARCKHLLQGLSRDGVGLEIGPSYQPIAPKRDGWRVETVDYLNEDALREKLRAQGHDVSRVEHVDHVWAGQRFSDLLGPARFDWVIASHVVEHVPDLIAFLQDCEAILKPGGVLAIALPDRRQCFDVLRPSTSIARILDAHLERRVAPSPGAVAEHVLFAALSNNQLMWSGRPGAMRFAHDDAGLAIDLARQVVDTGAYHDVHVWTFTIARFRLVVHDLWRMKLLGLREVSAAAGAAGEFYCHLSTRGSGPREDRMTLARQAAAEEGARLG